MPEDFKRPGVAVEFKKPFYLGGKYYHPEFPPKINKKEDGSDEYTGGQEITKEEYEKFLSDQK